MSAPTTASRAPDLRARWRPLIVWGLFALLIVIGVVLALRASGQAPILLDVVN